MLFGEYDDIFFPQFLGCVRSKKRLSDKSLNKKFPDCKRGDFIINKVVTKKQNQKSYTLVKIGNNSWCYYLDKKMEE